MTMRWYVVHAYSGQEKSIQAALIERIRRSGMADKFGEVLAKSKKKIDEASNTIDAAQRRTRAMTRSLKSVEAVPDARVQALIPGLQDDVTDDVESSA